jgi:hypothetical protein
MKAAVEVEQVLRERESTPVTVSVRERLSGPATRTSANIRAQEYEYEPGLSWR